MIKNMNKEEIKEKILDITGSPFLTTMGEEGLYTLIDKIREENREEIKKEIKDCIIGQEDGDTLQISIKRLQTKKLI